VAQRAKLTVASHRRSGSPGAAAGVVGHCAQAAAWLVITRECAPRDCAEALSELQLLARFEFEDTQGTVGKRSTSAFRWRHWREPCDVSEPSTIDSDHSDQIIRFDLPLITQLADKDQSLLCPSRSQRRRSLPRSQSRCLAEATSHKTAPRRRASSPPCTCNPASCAQAVVQ
jgi:hypothetical protein